MNLPESLSIQGGHLYCGGVDTVELARKFGGSGSPAFVNGILGKLAELESQG